MKFISRFILASSSAALFSLTVSPSFASVVSNIHNGGDTTVSITRDGILFHDGNPGYADASTSMGASATGSRFAGPSSSFWDNAGSPGAQADPAGSNSVCDLSSVGQSCTIEIGSLGSPIILTYVSPGKWATSNGSSALLSVSNGSWLGDLPGLFIGEDGDSTFLHIVRSGNYGGTVPPVDPAPEPRAVWAVAMIGVIGMVGAAKLRKFVR